MGDLASLHAQARRLIVALRSGLDRLEAQEGVSLASLLHLQSFITTAVMPLQRAAHASQPLCALDADAQRRWQPRTSKGHAEQAAGSAGRRLSN